MYKFHRQIWKHISKHYYFSSKTIMVDQVSLFKKIGLTEQKAKETVKNQVLGKKLEGIVLKAISITGESIEKPVGVLLYTLASSSLNDDVKVGTATEYVSHGKIRTVQQLNAAVDYLKSNMSQLDVSKFEEACGVDIAYTPEQIETAVEQVLKSHKKDIIEKRYHFNVGMLIGEVSRNLKWVDTKKVKSEIDMQLLDMLGPKTEADKLPAKKGEKKPKEKKKEVKKEEKAILNIEDILKIIDPKNIYRAGEAAKFHKPGENHKTEGYEVTKHTADLMDQHIKEYGAQVRTRFPPEPNGILHIGHAKAINFNFGYAKAHDGVTFLRYDDTNPEKEEERFFRGISDMVEWLGFKPFQVTHASDYFDELYQYAVDLIKRGGAYVCHQQQNEIQGHNPPPSPWRDRPVHESLQLFEDMKSGLLDEGSATLRMKIVMEDGKMDPVAYRIKFTPHPRTGDKWCIYPTYDFTHCLNDSLEHITHSLCTKEFQSRRSSYYWLCNSLDVYCPVQWEYSRLNLNYTVVSKRKIAKLIDNKIVADWDDPRLYTLSALRRRGFPPEAINYFCAKIGVTMSQTTLDPSMLDACVRDVLNVTAHRAMAVLDPLKVVITNFTENDPVSVEVPNIPNNPSAGSHVVPFSKVIYIDRTDFRENSDASYKRLTATQTVGLRHAGRVISVDDIRKDGDGKIIELHVSCKPSSTENKPKAFIQWVSNPIRCELRLYNQLFLHSNPEDPKEVPGGFLSDINQNSLELIENAYIDVSVKNAKPRTCFQFERVGYFAVDEDTTSEKMVFNRTVPLKEDAGKNI